MRYPPSEKLEIIRLVEQSHLPAKQTLDLLGIPRSTFYLWYDKYQSGGVDALTDKAPMPSHVWNRIPDDVREQIIDLALEEPELSPRELAVRFTDTKSYFVSGQLADWLKDEGMDHVRGAPYHPQTQSKIERCHQTLKNRILLENYFLPGDLNARIERFVEHYNHQRYRKSLKNLTPADVYFGRGQTILLERERIKQNTFKQRRLQYRNQAA